MPSASPDTARLDDALDRANRLRHMANICRHDERELDALAAKFDAHADAIMSEMKDEGHG